MGDIGGLDITERAARGVFFAGQLLSKAWQIDIRTEAARPAFSTQDWKILLIKVNGIDRADSDADAAASAKPLANDGIVECDETIFHNIVRAPIISAEHLFCWLPIHIGIHQSAVF